MSTDDRIAHAARAIATREAIDRLRDALTDDGILVAALSDLAYPPADYLAEQQGWIAGCGHSWETEGLAPRHYANVQTRQPMHVCNRSKGHDGEHSCMVVGCDA